MGLPPLVTSLLLDQSRSVGTPPLVTSFFLDQRTSVWALCIMPMHNCMVMYVYLCVSNMHHFCVKCPFVACESRKIEHFFNNVNWGSCEKQKMSTLIRLIRWNVLWNDIIDRNVHRCVILCFFTGRLSCTDLSEGKNTFSMLHHMISKYTEKKEQTCIVSPSYEVEIYR